RVFWAFTQTRIREFAAPPTRALLVPGPFRRRARRAVLAQVALLKFPIVLCHVLPRLRPAQFFLRDVLSAGAAARAAAGEARVDQVAPDDLLRHLRAHSALGVDVNSRHARERTGVAAGRVESDILALLAVRAWGQVFRLVAFEEEAQHPLVAERAADE